MVDVEHQQHAQIAGVTGPVAVYTAKGPVDEKAKAEKKAARLAKKLAKEAKQRNAKATELAHAEAGSMAVVAPALEKVRRKEKVVVDGIHYARDFGADADLYKPAQIRRAIAHSYVAAKSEGKAVPMVKTGEKDPVTGKSVLAQLEQIRIRSSALAVGAEIANSVMYAMLTPTIQDFWANTLRILPENLSDADVAAASSFGREARVRSKIETTLRPMSVALKCNAVLEAVGAEPVRIGDPTTDAILGMYSHTVKHDHDPSRRAERIAKHAQAMAEEVVMRDENEEDAEDDDFVPREEPAPEAASATATAAAAGEPEKKAKNKKRRRQEQVGNGDDGDAEELEVAAPPAPKRAKKTVAGVSVAAGIPISKKTIARKEKKAAAPAQQTAE